MNRTKVTLIILVFLTSFMYSCYDEKDFDFDKLSDKVIATTTMAFPIGYTQMTIQGYLEGDSVNLHNYLENIYYNHGVLYFLYYDIDSIPASALGNSSVVKEDTIKMGIFDDFGQQVFSFEDPKIHVVASNPLDQPVTFSIDGLHTNLDDNITLPQTSFTLAAGESIDILYDKNDISDLRTAINNSPTQLRYTMNMNQVSGASSAESVAVQVQIELPMYGQADRLVLEEDTLQVEFDEMLSDLDDLEKLVIKLRITNGFPVGGETQVYFLDASNQVVDSLFDNGQFVLNYGEIGLDGRVIPTENDVMAVEINREKMDKLKVVNKMTISAVLTTTDTPIPVIFYQDYGIRVEMAAIFSYSLDTQSN